jgi:hypothetical protein
VSRGKGRKLASGQHRARVAISEGRQGTVAYRLRDIRPGDVLVGGRVISAVTKHPKGRVTLTDSNGKSAGWEGLPGHIPVWTQNGREVPKA